MLYWFYWSCKLFIAKYSTYIYLCILSDETDESQSGKNILKEEGGLDYTSYLSVSRLIKASDLYCFKFQTVFKTKKKHFKIFVAFTLNFQLDTLLSSQNMKSTIHDEHLFIITHQGNCFLFKK